MRPLTLIALLAAVASAAPKSKAEPVADADVSAVKDKLVVWTDGKKHFIALPLTTQSPPIFWSEDGRDFYALRVLGGGSEGYDDDLKRLDRNFWEPRQRGGEASVGYRAETGKLTLECAERTTPMEKLDGAESKKLIEAGHFHKSRWPRYAYALARDDKGNYYFVDNLREPESAKNFRLFAGPKGALKLQKMINIVSDSQGDIFSTAHGDLRLVLAKQASTWIAHDKPTTLLWVPVEDNAPMIYTDLGVYNGLRLGTPCDAL